MTPQEQELLSELFDRLAKSETNPRDLDAAGGDQNGNQKSGGASD